MYDDTDVVGCSVMIFIIVCLLAIGLCFADLGIEIYNEMFN